MRSDYTLPFETIPVTTNVKTAWEKIVVLFKNALNCEENCDAFTLFFKSAVRDSSTSRIVLDPNNPPWFNFFILCNHIVYFNEYAAELTGHYLLPIFRMAIRNKIFPDAALLSEGVVFENGKITVFSVMIATLEISKYEYFFKDDKNAALPEFILSVIKQLSKEACIDLVSRKIVDDNCVARDSDGYEMLAIIDSMNNYFTRPVTFNYAPYFSMITEIVISVIHKCSSDNFESLFLTFPGYEKSIIALIIDAALKLVDSFKYKISSITEHPHHYKSDRILLHKSVPQLKKGMFRLLLNIYDKLAQLNANNQNKYATVTKQTKKLITLLADFHSKDEAYATFFKAIEKKNVESLPQYSVLCEHYNW